MRTRRLCMLLLLVGLAVPLAVLAGVERNPRGAIETGSDASQLARDQRELIDFKVALAALDDALMRNHLEAYYSLNSRLQGMMDRELRQSRARIAEATAASEKSRRERRTEQMKASMGGTGSDFFQLQDERRDVRDAEQDIAGTRKRREEMMTILRRFEALQVGVHEGDDRAYARNAAFLDQFFKLMRDERAEAIEREAGDR